MLKIAPTLASGAVHTAENEPLKISLVHFISSITSLVILHARHRRTRGRIDDITEVAAVVQDAFSDGTGEENAFDARRYFDGSPCVLAIIHFCRQLFEDTLPVEVPDDLVRTVISSDPVIPRPDP